MTRAIAERRILCVLAHDEPSFGTVDPAYHLAKAFSPPRGLPTIAACLPAHWPVRFLKETVTPAGDDLASADAVLVAGMHIQRRKIDHRSAAARLMGHHLIAFARDVRAGRLDAWHHATRLHDQAARPGCTTWLHDLAARPRGNARAGADRPIAARRLLHESHATRKRDVRAFAIA